MWYRYKILILPLLVYLAGGISLLIGESPVQSTHIMKKGFPFPPEQETKTEWTIPSQPAKISRSFTPIIFTPYIIKVKRTSFVINITKEDSDYTFFYYSDLKGRSPPSLLS